MTIKSIKGLQGLNVEAVAKAIEADAGQKVPGVRQALREAKTGKVAAVHTPSSLASRKHQGAYEKRKLASGGVRIPGGMLSPAAAHALETLLSKGAQSKVAAINQALIAAAENKSKKAVA